MNAFERNKSPYEQSFDIAFGAFMESAVDEATFGIYHPDIVPEDVEQAYPVSSTVGKVVGTLVGMIPSFAVSFGAARKVLSLFPFGRKVAEGALRMGLSPKIIEKSVPFVSSSLESMGGFALHDVAREYVRQVDQDDPDATNMVRKAVGGAAFGLFTSIPALAFHKAHPFYQAVTQGAAFGIASAVSDATDGIDVMDEDYWKTQGLVNIAQGVGFGLWQSRGWRARRDFSEILSKNNWEEFSKGLKNLDSPESQVAYKTIYETLNEINIKTPELIDPQYKPIFDKMISWTREATKKGYTEVKPTRGKLKGLQKLLGFDDPTWHEYLNSQTGKTSSKDLSETEINQVFHGLLDYVGMHYSKEKAPMQIRSWTMMEKLFGAGDRVLMRIGAEDLFTPLIAGDVLMKEEMILVKNYMLALQHQWERAWVKQTGEKVSLKGQVKGAFGFSNAAIKDFKQRIDTGNYEGVSNEMKGVINEYEKFTDFFFDRLNQVRRVFDQKPIKKVEFYSRAMIDVNAMIRKGKKALLPANPEDFIVPRKGLPEKTIRSTEMSRQPEAIRAQYEYIDNPFYAAINMAQLDLKKIYLDIPRLSIKREIDMLKAQKKVSERSYQDMMDFVNIGVYTKPHPSMSRVNEGITRLLDETKVGAAIEQYAAHLNVTLRHNPAKTLANGYGSLVSSSMIGLRPKQAIRNSMQFLMALGQVDAKNITRGMLWREPELLTRIKKESIAMRVTKSQAEEHIGKTFTSEAGALINEVQFGMMMGTQAGSSSIAYNSGYWQVMDKIKRGEKGWSDPKGVELRKTNPNHVTEYEIDNIKKFCENLVKDTQFLYTAWSLPMVLKTPAAPLFKLMSFPMFYAHRYLGESLYRLHHGKPSWAEGKEGFKLSLGERFGIVKQIVGVGVLVAALDEMDMDYTSILPMSYTKTKGFKLGGTIDFRPSPLVSMIEAFRDYWSDDPYRHAVGKKNLINTAPIPLHMATKDIVKAMKTGEGKELIFYKPYKRTYNNKRMRMLPNDEGAFSFPRRKRQPFSIGIE